MAVVAMSVLPWSAFKLGFYIRDSLRSPQLIPLTRIQKLKAQQIQAANAAAMKAGGGAAVVGETVNVQPAGASSSSSSSSSSALLDPVTASKSNAAASGLTQENLRPAKPWLSCGNVTLALLWLLFLYMLLQIPSFQHENLASFKPYEILGLPTEGGKSTATDEEIKRAYRKQSLVYHPDRNPSPEAAQQFMLVAKAYETLTSPTAKANIEKYGNPDGYQGVSVTIGLPSMLTKKENEMRVLVIYFFIFILLPPIAVWVWWRSAKDFAEGGLLKKTLGLWYQLMLPNMGSKFLVEFLCIADENQVLLSAAHPTDVAEFKRLALEVKPSMVKQRFQDAKTFGSYFQYAAKASILMHAYLLRIQLSSKQMKDDLDFLLKDAHKFLGVMMELALQRGFVRTVFGVFDLMQLVTQGLFTHDSPLLQLPHLTAEDCRKLNRKNIKTPHHILKMLGAGAPAGGADKLAKILPDITPKQWADIRSVAELIPDVELTHSYSVEDEEGLYEGDLVTLKVQLERMSFDPDKPDSPEQAYRLSQHEGDESTQIASAGEDKEQSPADKAAAAEKAAASAAAAAAAKGKSNKAKFAAAAGASGSAADDGEKKEDGAIELASMEKESALEPASPSSSSSSSTAVVPSPTPSPPAMTDDEILDSMPEVKKTPAVPDLLQSGPSVHSLTFPHPKHERWYVLLVEKSKKLDRIIGMHKVQSFFDDSGTMEIKFYAPRAKSAKEDGLAAGSADIGVWDYEIHAICDSYLGVDVVKGFRMKVDKPRHSQGSEEHAAKVKEKVNEEYAELKLDATDAELEAEYDGKWYWAGFESFWELALNALVLGLLCVFIFNFLQSRGYWQKYIQPGTDFVGEYTGPVWRAAYPYLAPVLDPAVAALRWLYATTAELLHRDLSVKHPDDIHIDENAIPGMGQED